MNRRQWIRRLAPVIALAGLGLGGCSGLGGPPVITLSESELNALIARSFPMQRRVLELLEVQMSAPQLRLLPETNRLKVDLGLNSRDRLLGRSASGRLAFDSALRWDPREAALRLTQVRVQQLQWQTGGAPTGAAGAETGRDPADGGQATTARLGALLAELALEDLVIYRPGAERLASLRQSGLQPGAVTVTSRGLEITLARIGS